MKCDLCNRDVSVTGELPDSTATCASCDNQFRPYFRCCVCDKELTAEAGHFNRTRFERTTCGDEVCRNLDLVRRGQLCCHKATFLPCSCAQATACPDHGERHRGTHD